MIFFQNFMYWFKRSTGQGTSLVRSVEALRPLGCGPKLPVPFLSTPAQELPREAGLCTQPHSTAEAGAPTRQPEPVPRKLLPPSLHFPRCLESILFCSHSAPGPNPFQYWLWATIYNEIQMSVTYGKSDSH